MFVFSLSIDHSTCGGVESNGGKSINNGLDDNGGEVFVNSFDCDSGDKRHAVDEGGVNGVHIGTSGDKDDEVTNNGIGRFVESAFKWKNN